MHRITGAVQRSSARTKCPNADVGQAAITPAIGARAQVAQYKNCQDVTAYAVGPLQETGPGKESPLLPADAAERRAASSHGLRRGFPADANSTI